MPTVIERFARWACSLRALDLPPAVRSRARLQQIHLAGAIHAVADRPRASAHAPSAAAERARRLADLGGWLELDDVVLGGRTGAGAAPAAWALATGEHALRDLDLAVVVGNELGGRAGLARLVGPHLLSFDPAATALAAAAAGARLRGLDVDAFAHALALSLEVSVGADPGEAAWRGVEAVERAAAGQRGALERLDGPDVGADPERCWLPLPAALTGLGRAWLTETVALKHTPGPLAAQVAIQGVAEVLRRHVKAADKRLRVDQLESITVRTGALGCALQDQAPDSTAPEDVVRSLPQLLGVLLTAYELGPAQLESGWLAENRESIRHVAGRVQVEHDPERSLALLRQVVTVAAPLLADAEGPALRRAARRLHRMLGVEWGPGGAGGAAAEPAGSDAGPAAARGGGSGQARLEEWQFRFDTEVKVFTTRGGSWPERRAIPGGEPRLVLGRHGRAHARASAGGFGAGAAGVGAIRGRIAVGRDGGSAEGVRDAVGCTPTPHHPPREGPESWPVTPVASASSSSKSSSSPPCSSRRPSTPSGAAAAASGTS